NLNPLEVIIENDGPRGIAVDANDNVFIATNGDEVKKFTRNGSQQLVEVASWGGTGTGNGQFNSPWAVACDPAGNVYVTEFNNDRVQKFDNNGNFITKWGTEGTADGQFNGPTGIAVYN